jgi:glycerol transport system ATP-binding protein
MKWELRTQLKSLHRQFGHTMIYVTHDQTEALTFADRVVVMHEGRVVQTGTPQDLFDAPAHTFVGYFIGSPGMNLLDATVEGDRARIGETVLPLGARYGRPSGRVQIGIRPEFVGLSDRGGLPVTLTRVEDVGRHRILRAAHAGREVNAILAEGTALPAGPLHLLFDPAHTLVYADDWRLRPEGSSFERAA